MLKEFYLVLARIGALNIGCEAAHILNGREFDALTIAILFFMMTFSWTMHEKL